MPNAIPERATSHTHPFATGAHARVLASTLAHLLHRDEGTPARWHTPEFATAVEAIRRELRSGDGIPGARTRALDPAREVGFNQAAARLAREPLDVAAALLHLELTRREQLPAWRELVRHGLPSHTDLDAALWFG